MESPNLVNIVNTNRLPQTCSNNVAYNIMSNTNANNYNINDDMNNLCKCTIIDIPNGTQPENMTCPNGQLVSTHYPLLNKIECCTECNVNPVKYTVPDGCDFNKQFIPDLSMFYENPYFNTERVNTNKELDNTCLNSMVNNQLCNETIMTSVKDKCTLYDIAPAQCNEENIKNVEQKCATHELKYYDSNLGMYVNSNSPFYCHNDLSGMDNYCKENGINSCNFTNMTKTMAQTNKVNISQEMIEPMNGNIGSESTEIKIYDNSNLYFLIFICVILLVILIGIYFYRKKNVL
jgi:hypothetical protein